MGRARKARDVALPTVMRKIVEHGLDDGGPLFALRQGSGAQLLAQHVDRHQRAVQLELPEGPAIAGIQTLHMRAHLVDRAGGIGA